MSNFSPGQSSDGSLLRQAGEGALTQLSPEAAGKRPVSQGVGGAGKGRQGSPRVFTQGDHNFVKQSSGIHLLEVKNSGSKGESSGWKM